MFKYANETVSDANFWWIYKMSAHADKVQYNKHQNVCFERLVSTSLKEDVIEAVYQSMPQL